MLCATIGKRRTQMRWAARLGTVIALTLGLTPAVVAAGASRAAGLQHTELQRQLAADAVADHLDALVAGMRVPGFAGEEVLPAGPGLDVYWHGRHPRR